MSIPLTLIECKENISHMGMIEEIFNKAISGSAISEAGNSILQWCMTKSQLLCDASPTIA
jgi:hypothetical protein